MGALALVRQRDLMGKLQSVKVKHDSDGYGDVKTKDNYLFHTERSKAFTTYECFSKWHEIIQRYLILPGLGIKGGIFSSCFVL